MATFRRASAPRVVQRPAGDRRHSRRFLLRGDVHRDPVVLHHRDQRLAQLRIVPVRVGVYEVEDFLRAAAVDAVQTPPGGPAKETPRRHPRQLPALGDPQRLLQQPAHLPIAQCPVGQRADLAGRRGEQVQPRHQPIAQRQAGRRNVGALALPHQPGNVHARGTLQPARVAVDAEVGGLLELVAGQQTQVDAPGEDAANDVRLRPGRGLLGGGEAEDRAHPHLRRLRAALAATVARLRGVQHPRRIPVQLQFDQVAELRRVAFALGRGRLGRRRQRRAEAAHVQFRIVADDLSRVENVSRVENPLHFAKDLVERSDLPGQERRAAQAVGVSAAHGAVGVDDFLVKFLRPPAASARRRPDRRGSETAGGATVPDPRGRAARR